MSSNDFFEMMMLQRLTGGSYAGAQTWLQVAFLVCLFGAAVIRPEVIRSRPLFRAACILFALSLLISPTLNYLLAFVMQGTSSPYGRYGPDGEMMLLMSVPSIGASVLFGISLICGLLSLGMVPGKQTTTAQSSASEQPDPAPAAIGPLAKLASPTPPKPHPLDEPD